MKVLVYIDSSPYAPSNCDHAAWVATRLSIPVELIHVIEKTSYDTASPANLSGQLGIDSRRELLKELVALDAERNKLKMESGRYLLADAADHVKAAGVAEVTTRLVHGSLVDHLRDHEQEARVLVVGKRGEGAHAAKGHLGTNLERVIRASHRPILVAPQTFHPISRFLFAYDGGSSAEEAVNRLVNSPLLRDTPGTLVTVGDDSQKNREQLENAASRLRAAGYSIESELRDGDPNEVIPDMVNTGGFDLLVMGAYGHSRIRRLLIGSTTTHLIRTSTKPIIVVR